MTKHNPYYLFAIALSLFFMLSSTSFVYAAEENAYSSSNEKSTIRIKVVEKEDGVSSVQTPATKEPDKFSGVSFPQTGIKESGLYSLIGTLIIVFAASWIKFVRKEKNNEVYMQNLY